MSFFIDSNVGNITVSQVCDFANTDLGYCPYDTQQPTVITFNDYKPRLTAITGFDPYAVYNSYVQQYFNSEEDLEAYVSRNYTQFYDKMIWLWGDPIYGGCALAPYNSSSFRIYFYYGIYLHPTYQKYFVNGYGNLFNYDITVNNSNFQHQHVEVPTGTYPNTMILNELYHVGYSGDITNSGQTMCCIGAPLITKNWYDTPTSVNSTPYSQYMTSNQWHDRWTIDYTTLTDVTNVMTLRERVLQYRITSAFTLTLQKNTESTSGWIDGQWFGTETSEVTPYLPDYVDGGGGGGGGISSTDQGVDPLPTNSLLNSGFVTLYNPTLSEIQQFASFLFTGLTDSMVNNLKKLLVNPLDYILSLSMVRFNPNGGNKEDIEFCGIDSGVDANLISDQYKHIKYKCATDIYESYKTALDYSNYTKAKIYIPYCGMYDVNIDMFMDGQATIDYYIDKVSGQCIAQLSMVKTGGKNKVAINSIVGVYTGNVLYTMPISSTDWRNTFNSLVGIATTFAMPSVGAVAGIAKEVTSQKVNVQTSGNLSSNYGFFGKQNPYIIIERPRTSVSTLHATRVGYPSYETIQLGKRKGFVKLKNSTFRMDKFPKITKQEIDELNTIMNEGVVVPETN